MCVGDGDGVNLLDLREIDEAIYESLIQTLGADGAAALFHVVEAGGTLYLTVWGRNPRAVGTL